MPEPHPKTVELKVAEAEARVENLPVDLAAAAFEVRRSEPAGGLWAIAAGK